MAIIQEYSDRTTSNIINFQPIDESFVSKHISKLNVKKATGIDGISPKLLHYAKSVVTKAITNLINLSLSKSIFPDSLKIAQVAPDYKKTIASLKRVIIDPSVCSPQFHKSLKQP